MLNLATMRWTVAGAGAPLPLSVPRCYHALAAFGEGRVVAVGRWNELRADAAAGGQCTRCKWVPGNAV